MVNMYRMKEQREVSVETFTYMLSSMQYKKRSESGRDLMKLVLILPLSDQVWKLFRRATDCRLRQKGQAIRSMSG